MTIEISRCARRADDWEKANDARSRLNVRGVRFLAKGRYDRALADFDRAIELDPAEDEFAAARTEICQVTGGSDDDALPSNRGTTAT